MNRDGAVARVVVRPIPFVELPMLFGLGLVAKLSVDQRQVVMGRDVLAVQLKCLLKLGFRQKKKLPLALPICFAVFHLGPFEQSLAKLVDDFVVLAEIESPLVQLG